MSILKDLDPQYAKLHSEPSLRKPLLWAGLALLTLGGAYWIATQSTTKEKPAEAKIFSAPQAPEASSESLTGKPPLPATPSTTQAATIHDEPNKTKNSEQQGTPASSAENATRTSLADAEYPRPAQSTPNKTSTTPSRPSSPATKAENMKHKPPSSQTLAKNEKTSGASGKKTIERDIDIITAIVR